MGGWVGGSCYIVHLFFVHGWVGGWTDHREGGKEKGVSVRVVGG